MTTNQAAVKILGALASLRVPCMLVGSYSSNFYAIPRATKDVDIVVELSSHQSLTELTGLIGPEFTLDDQVTFETITGNLRHIIRCRRSAIVVELFELKEDSYQKERFRRRREVFVPQLGISVFLPTAEDVIVQKLRWGRPKDLDDAAQVYAIQLPKLDLAYVENWCQNLNILDRYQQIVSQASPL